MKYLIIESSGDGHDVTYKAEVAEEGLLLKYAGSAWVPPIRGGNAARLVDTGDEFLIKFDTGLAQIELDYSQASQMLLLLQMYNSEQRFTTKFEKYQLVED